MKREQPLYVVAFAVLIVEFVVDHPTASSH